MAGVGSVKGNKVLAGESPKAAGGVTRRNFLLYTVGTLAGSMFLGTMNTGCGGGGGNTGTVNFPVLVFSDVHFDPLYDGTLFQNLVSEDISQWPTIFRGSSTTTPSAWGTDTNYPLLASALSSISQNVGACPFVIFSGDILCHFLAQRFYVANGTPDPLNPSTTDQAAMIAFTDKTVAFFMQQVRLAVGNIPVFFALGNADSYTGLGPDSTFLLNNAEAYYTQFVNGTVDQQTFLNTFTSGGYYTAEPPDTDLRVIGLNTFEFSPPGFPLPDYSNAVTAELAWFDSALGSAQADRKNVWLIMHVPPGAAITQTAANVNGSGQITSAGTTMMWDQGYQDHFLQILSNYPGLITHTFGAHTHMDEYRIVSSNNVIEITGGITPYFGNNPAYKVFTFSPSTQAVDYTAFNYDLASLPGQFNSYYTFSTAYSASGLLDGSLAQLYPALVTNSGKQALYRGYYLSGHNYAVATTNEIVPITNTNWPVFWSGIGNMDETPFIDGVNLY